MSDKLFLKELYASILQQNNPMQEVKRHCYSGLTDEQNNMLAKRDIQVYEGKVRQCLFHGDEVDILHTDRLSAFDRFIGDVPYKGNILATIASYWFEKINENLPTHFLKQAHPRVIKAKRLEPIKAEVIVRGYLAGSMMRSYEKGERNFCGAILPEGLKNYGKLAKPIITPTSKAEAFEHDENRTPEQLIEEGVCSREEWEKISKLALDIFALGQKIYAEKGWILVDTKYEFGRDKEGNIYIIDEVHTPDSSRLWVEKTYDEMLAANKPPVMLDKEVVRRELIEKGFQGEGPVPEISAESIIGLASVYLTVAEALTGKPMVISETKEAVNLSDLNL
ncbi:MAG: phosphoribosylaminoimidazolesuccinocarboxamide synthase [Bdellovibrionota bacterium]